MNEMKTSFGRLQSVEDLDKVKRACCRVKHCEGRASGFLVQFPKEVCTFPCLLTNAHVINNIEKARSAVVEFGSPKLTVRLCPDKFFMTSPAPEGIADRFHLDYTAVAIKSADLKRGRIKPLTPFIAQSGLPVSVRGDAQITIVQFPTGMNEQQCIATGSVIKVEECFFNYNACTDYGSSGSPCLDANYNVMGIHCRRYPALQCNQGTPISAILGDLRLKVDACSLCVIPSKRKNVIAHLRVPFYPCDLHHWMNDFDDLGDMIDRDRKHKALMRSKMKPAVASLPPDSTISVVLKTIPESAYIDQEAGCEPIRTLFEAKLQIGPKSNVGSLAFRVTFRGSKADFSTVLYPIDQGRSNNQMIYHSDIPSDCALFRHLKLEREKTCSYVPVEMALQKEVIPELSIE